MFAGLALGQSPSGYSAAAAASASAASFGSPLRRKVTFSSPPSPETQLSSSGGLPPASPQATPRSYREEPEFDSMGMDDVVHVEEFETASHSGDDHVNAD